MNFFINVKNRNWNPLQFGIHLFPREMLPSNVLIRKLVCQSFDLMSIPLTIFKRNTHQVRILSQNISQELILIHIANQPLFWQRKPHKSVFNFYKQTTWTTFIIFFSKISPSIQNRELEVLDSSCKLMQENV